MLFRKRTEEKKDIYFYNSRPKKNGLTTDEAIHRLQVYGQNVLIKKRKKSALNIFIEQFNDFIIWVLLIAAIISGLMGERADAITITAIVILNGIMGFIQEYRTEKSLDALKELSAPTVKAVRDGKVVIIPAHDIVPDDLIILESGDRVPADSMLIESNGIQVDESLLTGESAPVEKMPIENTGKQAIKYTEQNMVHMGTVLTGGRGKAVVLLTGMATEMGKIADMLQNVEEEQTPLQKKLDRMGKVMVFGCIFACAIVTIMGILKGENIYTMFLTGVSLAVAAIPEGLPAIVTVSLTLGVQRMLKRNALIRRLPAVETLGCTNIICSDKTGTLTENKMTVKRLYYDGAIADVLGNGYDAEGKFIKAGKKIYPKGDRSLQLLLESAVSCTNSGIETAKPSDKIFDLKKYNREIVSASGDPTEIALLVCGYKAGISKEEVDKKYKRVAELPFDPTRKRMSVIVRYGGDYYVFLKGAIDNTIDLCSSIHSSNGISAMTQGMKNTIMLYNGKMAKDALRVIAIAYKKLPGMPFKINVQSVERDLTFIGLMGMIDPPRKEAIEAIEICSIAGIKPVMITGDHKDTAIAVAKQLKLMKGEDKVLVGKEIDAMSEKALQKEVRNVSVYARVTPEHKLRIVRAYKKNGYIVAMTGDGVNDAPAVKEADIGVCMGKSGTDVTKEASAMVLLDDNFATIVAAVEEGRVIYDNIRKFIRYLLSCNLGEVLTMFIASLLNFQTPLIPIQILWVNLVTDGLPAIALGVDPPDKNIMLRPPRKKDESIFSHGLSSKIIIRGILIGICTIAIFAITLNITGGNLLKARTMAFAALVMSQLIHVIECRSERYSIFEINIFSNIFLLIAILISTAMLALVIYVPYFQPLFKTVPLNFGDVVAVLFFSGAISLIVSLKTYIKS
ncbi:MAG: cation-translocating P-type ATPase [Clostridiales bacterium]|nr:cation-translocating P-type ATPase [Clostridiales bacterium]